MKKIATLLKFSLLAGVLAMGCFTQTGCAHASKNSLTAHERVVRGVALPPGWSVVVPQSTENQPASDKIEFIGTGNTVGTTNHVGLFSPRPKVFVAMREAWTDTSKGGGTFLFTDPQASQIASAATNQAALGGQHAFTVGAVTSTITTNAVAAITAGGNAVGNVIGTAAKAAAGKP
jgi:hypothetical protein